MAALRYSFWFVRGEDDTFVFDTDGSDVSSIRQFLAAGHTLDGVSRVFYRGLFGLLDVSHLWLPYKDGNEFSLRPWKLSFCESRPVTGRWVAESAGVTLCAGDRIGAISAIVQRKLDYPPHGH